MSLIKNLLIILPTVNTELHCYICDTRTKSTQKQ